MIVDSIQLRLPSSHAGSSDFLMYLAAIWQTPNVEGWHYWNCALNQGKIVPAELIISIQELRRRSLEQVMLQSRHGGRMRRQLLATAAS